MRQAYDLMQHVNIIWTRVQKKSTQISNYCLNNDDKARQGKDNAQRCFFIITSDQKKKKKFEIIDNKDVDKS